MKIPFLDHRKSNKIKIMQFWGGVPQSPNSKWLRTLRVVQKCVERGWRTAVVFSHQPHSQAIADPFLDAGAEILIHQRLPGSIKWSAIVKTFNFMHQHPCDLIHCHNRPIIPLIAASLNHVPVRIWSRLAMSSHYEENSKPLGIHKLHPNLRLSCYFSDKILCISKPVLYELVNLYKSVENKSTVVGGAVDLEFYSSGCAEDIRNEFYLSKDNITIVSIGHAVHVKGWDILLHAYAKFQKIFPQSKLLLIGSIEHDNERETSNLLFQLIETLSIKNNVILTGRRSDINNILAASDIYIQSSRSEGLCGALLEALAAGLPCIASNVGGTTDVIRCGENGLLFEREDIKGLAERMLTLARDPLLRKKLSSNAFPSVRHYGLESVTDNILQIYEEALSKRGVLRV